MILPSCLNFQLFRLRRTDKQFYKAFEEYNLTIDRYQVDGRTIRYLEIGNDSLPTIMFFHGSPSSMSMFERNFFRDSLLLANVHMVGVDRPGYGMSDFGKPDTSIAHQAEMIAPLVEKYAEKRLILLGSSYGGPVAARLAMTHPNEVDGLILVSSSNKPGAERTYKISYMIANPWWSWLFPRVIKTSNVEKLSHKAALEEIEKDWPKIICKTTILQGEEDDLVYPENALFADSLISGPTELILIPDAGHSLLWDHDELVINEILELAGVKRQIAE